MSLIEEVFAYTSVGEGKVRTSWRKGGKIEDCGMVEKVGRRDWKEE